MQGDLTGELRWEEVRDVKLATRPGGIQIGHQRPGIRIQVEGATIFLADIFNYPLYGIYQRVGELWRKAVV